jgi:hypothetical protein
MNVLINKAFLKKTVKQSPNRYASLGVIDIQPSGLRQERRYSAIPQSLRFIGGYSYADLRSVKKHKVLPATRN